MSLNHPEKAKSGVIHYIQEGRVHNAHQKGVHATCQHFKMLDTLKGVSWTTYFPADTIYYYINKTKSRNQKKVLFLILKASQAPLIEK